MTFSSSPPVTPTFLIGGAPKAGTSSLYHYLDQHPNVCMSARKETGVFMDNYDRGLTWLAETYYQHYDGESAVGEGSAGVLRRPECAERIYRALPEVKLIFLLRDPIDRLHSHFSFLQGVRAIDAEWSFSAYIRSDHRLRDRLIDQGFYHKHLTRFAQYFDRDQMLILLFDDLCTDTAATVRRAYQFIGVVSSFNPDLDTYNRTREPRFETAYRVLEGIWQKVRSHLSMYTINQTRRLRKAVKSVVTQTTNRGAMSRADAVYLHDLYADSNRKLAHWLERDLSDWERRPAQTTVSSNA